MENVVANTQRGDESVGRLVALGAEEIVLDSHRIWEAKACKNLHVFACVYTQGEYWIIDKWKKWFRKKDVPFFETAVVDTSGPRKRGVWRIWKEEEWEYPESKGKNYHKPNGRPRGPRRKEEGDELYDTGDGGKHRGVGVGACERR